MKEEKTVVKFSELIPGDMILYSSSHPLYHHVDSFVVLSNNLTANNLMILPLGKTVTNFFLYDREWIVHDMILYRAGKVI